MDVKKFVEIFNGIKTEEKGRKGTTKGLSERDERNFKKLIKRGFEEEDFRLAITQMFRDPEQWAVSTGNDIPAHFLRSENFDRYLNAALNKADKKQEIKPAEQPVPRKQLEAEEADKHLKRSRDLYKVALESGEWLGTVFNAAVIARDLAAEIEKEVKKKLWKESEYEYSLLDKKSPDNVGITPIRIFSEKIVEEAIKQKIVVKW